MNHKASFEVPSNFVVPSIFSCSNSIRFDCIPPHPSLKPRKPIPQTHSNEPTTPQTHSSNPLRRTHQSIPTHHYAQIKPQTQPSSGASLEQGREIWDERKRDFARSRRRRDRVGVRGREDWRRENWWNKKLIFSLAQVLQKILQYLGLAFPNAEHFEA